MADEPIDQDEIEALLQQAKQCGSGQPQASADDAARTLNQDEIETLMRGAGGSAGQPGAGQADPEGVLGQQEIEQLLQQAKAGTKDTVRPAAAGPLAPPPPPLAGDGISPGDIEFLLDQAEQALASVDQPRQETVPGLSAFHFPEFRGGAVAPAPTTFDLIRDVELDLKIELGRTQMYLEDVLKLRKGSVVPLDKLAGDPVDIYVNGRLIARGEVLVLNDNFCVRVNELLAAQEVVAG